MKWINGLTSQEKTRRREEWHTWFAWFPVMVGQTTDEHCIKVWWDYVERKGKFSWDSQGGCWIYTYRKEEKT